MSFQRAVDAFNLKVVDLTEQEFRAAALNITNETIRNTPVDTGRLRANWQATVGAPAASSLLANVTGKGKKGTAQKASNFARGNNDKVALGLKWDDDFYLTNNLAYARPVEEGGPHNKPVRMLARAIARVARAL